MQNLGPASFCWSRRKGGTHPFGTYLSLLNCLPFRNALGDFASVWWYPPLLSCSSSTGEKMNTHSESGVRPRQLGRSILALLAGIVLGIILSLGTDLGLHAIGLAPALSERWSNQLLFLATAYRTIYSVIGSYVVAWLAPNRPMGHALVAGASGLLASTLGAVAAWNSTTGQHWYPVALALIAMPTAWIGGRLRLLLEPRTTAA